MREWYLLFLTITFVVTFTSSTEPTYSGLYEPNVAFGEEYYGAAFLTGFEKLLFSDPISKMSNLRDTSLSIIKSGRTLMTRDFFDFEVVHLSGFIDYLPHDSSIQFLNYLLRKMKQNILSLADNSSRNNFVFDDNRRTTVLAVIPFASSPALSKTNPFKYVSSHNFYRFERYIRYLFFQAAFWTIYRSFPHVVVGVSTASDLKNVLSFKLPIYQIIDFSETLSNSSSLLPKFMLQNISSEYLRAGSPLKAFKYVYYTEGDQILHIRLMRPLLDSIKGHSGMLTIAPHRMQTLILPKAYEKFDEVWGTNETQRLKDVELVNEDEYFPRGSCCDNGRVVFEECMNRELHPAYCLNKASHNFSTWVRFGKRGLTVPLATEHGARCEYSSIRKTCPSPPNCQNLVPFNFVSSPCAENSNIDLWYQS